MSSIQLINCTWVISVNFPLVQTAESSESGTCQYFIFLMKHAFVHGRACVLGFSKFKMSLNGGTFLTRLILHDLGLNI